jgi:hypothetical protein
LKRRLLASSSKNKIIKDQSVKSWWHFVGKIHSRKLLCLVELQILSNKANVVLLLILFHQSILSSCLAFVTNPFPPKHLVVFTELPILPTKESGGALSHYHTFQQSILFML